MFLKFALAGVIAGAASMAAPTVQAASFTFTGGSFGALPGNFDPSPSVPGLGVGGNVLLNGALGLTGRGNVTFTYLGTEAGYDNQFLAGGTTLFDNKAGSNPVAEKLFGPGLMDFAFRTADPLQLIQNGSSSGSYGSIALFKLSEKSVYALFNDGSTSDQDYDDMAVRMDVAPVPLPAAAWMLMMGLGGLGLVKRRSGATAA